MLGHLSGFISGCFLLSYAQKCTTGTCDSLVTFYSLRPRKRNAWNILSLCVGVVLLKQWKQGNTLLSKTSEDPNLGVFFLFIFIAFLCCPNYPLYFKDLVADIFE